MEKVMQQELRELKQSEVTQFRKQCITFNSLGTYFNNINHDELFSH